LLVTANNFSIPYTKALLAATPVLRQKSVGSNIRGRQNTIE
jgi:hypothetical protein